MNTKYTGYKYFFLDVETTGVDRQKHNIFQIGGILTDPDLNILDQCNITFRPHSLEYVDDGALEKTKMTSEALDSLPLSSAEAYASFIGILSQHCNKFDKKDKIHFVAYNASFDVDFMREWFAKNGDTYFGSWFWNPPICIMQSAAWLTQRVRGALPNFQLGTVCQSAGLGWDEDAAHDAYYDILKSLELFKYLQDLNAKL